MKKSNMLLGLTITSAAIIIGTSIYITSQKSKPIDITNKSDSLSSLTLNTNLTTTNAILLNNNVSKNSLDKNISLALLSNLEGIYGTGECCAEGHIILGTKKNNDTTTVYALTTYGDYSFENNNFVKTSGSDVIPAVINLTFEDDNALFTEIYWPTDGSEYTESIKKLFPEEYHDRVISINDIDRNELKLQEQQYAKDYLINIDRNAQIGESGDFKHTLLTDLGISAEVINKLADTKYANYPSWIGNKEIIEDGTRYVYEVNLDKNNNEIILSKYNYETNEVIEQIKIDSLTGNEK